MRMPIIGLAILAHTRGALAEAVEQRLAILPMHAHRSFGVGDALFGYFSIKNRYELTRSGTVLQRYSFLFRGDPELQQTPEFLSS